MSDPWSIDYFNPPAPQVRPKSPAKSPVTVPEADRLYQVQRNAIKALRRVQEIERSQQGKDRHLQRELQQLERDIENTYRVIRSWLVKHT